MLTTRSSLLFIALALVACSNGNSSNDGPTLDATMDVPADTPPDCMTACNAAAARCAVVSADQCMAACARAGTAACLGQASQCNDAFLCVRGTPTVPFASGPYGTNPRDLAGPFQVQTTDGMWGFPDAWTGDDSYLFVIYQPGQQYSIDLWASDLAGLVAQLPPNVHMVFMSYLDPRSVDHAADHVNEIKTSMDQALATLAPEVQAHWRARMHYVTTEARSLNNWISTMLTTRGVPAFGIDRLQRIREIGYLASPGTANPVGDLTYIANEAVYFNFEWTRDQAHPAAGATVLPVINNTMISSEVFADVALPDAATMASFDTMEWDLSLNCLDHIDANCGQWDYLANLYMCDPPDPTMPSAPPVCTTEIGRWITSYNRESRWITDVSGLLALLQTGGTRHLHFSTTAQPNNHQYYVTLSLRLSNQHRGMHPSEAHYLFAGGQFTATYNNAYTPMTLTIPADVRKVDVVAFITGHGFGVEAANCAEFCNHTHHFSVNGNDNVKEHPEAGSAFGCADTVGQGTVPNQFGTWPFGRGGWCPGGDVPLWTVDVTSQVHLGQTNTISYQALFNGAPYVPHPVTNNSGGFPARIDMNSWVVYWR